MKEVRERLIWWRTIFNTLLTVISPICITLVIIFIIQEELFIDFISTIIFAILLGILTTAYIFQLGTDGIEELKYYIFPIVTLFFSFLALFWAADLLNDLIDSRPTIRGVNSEPIIALFSLSIALIIIWTFLFLYLPYQLQKAVLYERPNQEVKNEFEYRLENLRQDFPAAQGAINKAIQSMSDSANITALELGQFTENWRLVEQLITELLKRSRGQTQANKLPFEVVVNWAAPALGILGNLVLLWLRSVVLIK